MKTAPLLSIITVNLNNRAGLEQTIQGVINQKFTSFEFLIIDGGSNDGSHEIIDFYTDAISYWVSEPDRGIYHAMNKGIERATGQYCLFLNSGDWFVDEQVLERCFNERQTADLLIGGCHVSKNGRIIHTYKPTGEITFNSFYKTTIPHQSTFIKKALFDRLGNYRETYKIHGDYEFWIRSVITHQCSVAMLDFVVADYNLEGLSNRPEYSVQSQEEIRQILQQVVPERVLADYETWMVKRIELSMWEWVKSKGLLYGTIQFIYDRAVGIVALKQRLFARKSDQ
ncbi:glycosyltransferase family 2 protein [Spirosoma oryzicola]|uniref:glycosyltransferase family 2 protein n=1 Tax=Spirosoma oryzicola TaxID=2898794 RepID=UPI001E387FF7|nr:glycosyltransferase family 2 protein [Spirosoma oryzicola]UHG94039.1 glycosyltransferase [Spirosoma oryzicola]